MLFSGEKLYRTIQRMSTLRSEREPEVGTDRKRPVVGSGSGQINDGGRLLELLQLGEDTSRSLAFLVGEDAIGVNPNLSSSSRSNARNSSCGAHMLPFAYSM